MPRYSYLAVDRTGREVRGYLRADSAEEVESKLHDLDLYPLEVMEIATRPARGIFTRGVPLRILIDFTSSLAAVVGVGMPLLQGLKAIQAQLKYARFERALEDITRSVSAGEPLYRALSYHPHIFEEYYINLTRAGEEGGKLEMVLKDVARMLERLEEIRSKIREAMTYPAFIIGILAILIFIFLSFVLPTLFSIIKELNVPLPPITVFLMGFTGFMRASWWMILLGIVLAVFLYRFLYRYSPVRAVIDRIKLQIPVIGSVIWMASIARICRYLSTFYRAGIPLPQSLDLTAKISGNAVLQEATLGVKEWILTGDLLSRAIGRHPVFPPMMSMMTRMGEETGRMDEMLEEVADYYEKEADKAIRRALTLLEPVIILTVAIFVGICLSAVILPIYSIYQYI